MKISNGFGEAERAQVAALYWQAFGAKLGSVMRPTGTAHAFFRDVLDPGFALVARDAQGQLLGVAGFKTATGALANGGARDLARHYGLLGALWRGPLLMLLERSVEPGVLQMDGIFVDSAARGRGGGAAHCSTRSRSMPAPLAATGCGWMSSTPTRARRRFTSARDLSLRAVRPRARSAGFSGSARPRGWSGAVIALD